MKKIIILLSILFSISAYSQNFNGKWVVDYSKGDELLNLPPSTYYTYINKDGYVFFTNKNDAVTINTEYGIFDYYRGYTGTECVNVLVGFYSNNTLIEKQTYISIVSSSGKSDTTTIFGKEAKKIVAFLKESMGYIRFVIPRYGRSSLDISVPCNEKIIAPWADN